MELSKDYEFLSAALTAVSGKLVLDTKVPGPNTKLPDHYHVDYLWNDLIWRYMTCDLNSFSENIQTWYCQNPLDLEPKIGKEISLFVKTLTGKIFKVFIKNSCWVATLKEKIQDKEGIPLNQQRLMTNAKEMKNWWPLSGYNLENDSTVYLTVRLGICYPSASLLHKEMFDLSHNIDFTWLTDDGQIFKRGNFVYKRPYGWNRIAFAVKDKYEDNKWLGEDPGDDYNRTNGLKDEWPVAYQGNRVLLFKNMLKTEKSNKGKRSQFEMGVYSSPDPCVAEESAAVFTFKSRKFKVMVQSRVNMNDTAVVCDHRFYATVHPENVRPCGLLIKSIF